MVPIKHTLISLGISPDTEGFYFLIELIKRRIDWLNADTKPKYLITNEYAAIADDTYKASAVERACRYAIENAYNKGNVIRSDNQTLVKMLDNVISPDSGKPVIKAFVAIVAEYLREADAYEAYYTALKYM